MRKIRLYQDKVRMLFGPKYGMVKIRVRSILIFLLDYLLNFLEYIKGHMGYFFLFIRFKINLSRGEINKFI